MSIYNCSRCDEWYDGDYNVCSEDPKDNERLVCENCMCELDAEKEDRAAEIKKSHDAWVAELEERKKIAKEEQEYEIAARAAHYSDRQFNGESTK
jgi:hypothetical protein